MRKVFLAFAVLWMAVSHEAIAQERNPATGIMLRPLQEGLSVQDVLENRGNCLQLDAPQGIAHQPIVARTNKLGKVTTVTVRYGVLPTTGTVGVDCYATNYFDSDVSAAIVDYTGGNWAYNNHRGLDLAGRNFRKMDQGIPVVAVQSGVVYAIQDGRYDRRNVADLANLNDANLVVIKHSDNTFTWYGHLRKYSILPKVGEYVEMNQQIAYMGSSGYSDLVHIHLETTDTDNSTQLDQFNSNPANDLWQSGSVPFAYAGTAPMVLVDAGVMGIDEYINGTPVDADIKEYPVAPKTHGIEFGGWYFPFWFTIQSRTGDSIRVDLVYKNGTTVWASTGKVNVLSPLRFYSDKGYWGYSLSASDYGTWHYKFYVNGTLKKDIPFTVAATTTYKVRLKRAGKSFVVGSAITDTLFLHAYSSTPDLSTGYELVNEPTGVSLRTAGSYKVVDIASNVGVISRSTKFKVIVTDANGDKDTAYYHLVKPTINDFTLPVELVSFKGHWDGGKINLEWETASELNNVGYVLEHSSDKEAWERVADFRSDERLEGLGTSSTGKKYYFDVAGYDPSVLHYFRLTDVDYDGTMESHPAIRIEKPLAFFVSQAYPNPFNPSVNLNLAIPSRRDIEVKVYDLLGREVESQSMPAEPGRMRLNIDGSSWSSGLYMITIRQGDKFVVRKANLVK